MLARLKELGAARMGVRHLLRFRHLLKAEAGEDQGRGRAKASQLACVASACAHALPVHQHM